MVESTTEILNALDLCALAPDLVAGAFEGLGHGCELGVVQSFCGAEPVGLFRFSSLPHDKLIELAKTNFSKLDHSDETELFPAADGEWMVRVPRYGMEFHTRRSCKDISEEELLPKIRQRTRFLKRNFLEQLEHPTKILLRRDVERSPAEILDLYHVLRRYAPQRLLWVDHTNDVAQIGAIEILQEDVLRACYGYFWPNAAPSPAGLGIWLRILERGLRLLLPQLWTSIWDAVSKEVAASADHNLAKLFWYGCQSASAVRDAVIEPVYADVPVIKHVLGKDVSVDDGPIFCCDPLNLQPGRVYVVSAWVWLPTAFSGWVGIVFPGSAWIRMWPVDLAQRQSWQRIVTSIRVGGAKMQPGLVVQARRGETFFSTGWKVERGAIPADCLRLPSERN